MSWLNDSHEVLAFFVSLLWLVGFGILFLRPRGRKFDWLSLALLGLVIVVFAVDLFVINRDLPGQQKIWSRGWIGPRDQDGAITVGVLEDTLGLTLALASAGLGFLLLLNRGLIRPDKHADNAERTDRTHDSRMHAGVLMGVAGVSVAWLSLTPWLSILGTMLASLGGIVVLGARRDPEVVAQFGRERVWGFVLSFSGAAVLAGARAALTLERGLSLSQSGPRVFDLVGCALLVLGSFFFLQPVFFSNWVSKGTKVSTVASVIAAQLFPALAAFALLTRFEPEARAVGVFEVFQWVGIAAAVLCACSALAQTGWKTALPLWVSGMLSFSFAALCFDGPLSSLPILIGTLVSASALAFLGGLAEKAPLTKGLRSWYRPLCVLAALPGLGLPGFVSAGGVVRTLVQAGQDPGRCAALALAFLSGTVVLWKCVFSIFKLDTQGGSKEDRKERLPALLPVSAACLLVIAGLGLFWSGALSGGIIPHDPDRLFPSWIMSLLGAPASDWGDDSGVSLGEGLYCAAQVLSFLISIWVFGREQDRIFKLISGFPGLRRFLESGYSTEKLESIALKGLRAIGDFLENWITEKISVRWVPSTIERALRFVARCMDNVDRDVYRKEESILRQWVDVPGKALQLVQNGDMQWYLVFAVGCIAAVLIHFLKT